MTSINYWAIVLALFLLYYRFSNLKYQNFILLVGSILFYIINAPGFFWLILATTVIGYFCGQRLEKRSESICGIITVILFLAILAYYKYVKFYFGQGGKSIIVPLGISFYTFSLISYLVDVKKKKIKAQRDFVAFFLYTLFFPKIICGPIHRADDFFFQLSKDRYFDLKELKYSLHRILFGLFKKIVIADMVAIYVDEIWNNTNKYYGGYLVLAVILYYFQIYFDFSGYTDIALGTAKLFNIKLVENFQRPYYACSLKDFWNRWHISLSNWLKDYVYIPLGGSRNGMFRQVLHILIVFLVSGAWHGAGVNFLIWGVYMDSEEQLSLFLIERQ